MLFAINSRQTTKEVFMTKEAAFKDELTALGLVLKALEPLKEDKRLFVLRTTMDRLGIDSAAAGIRISPAAAPTPGVNAQPGIPVVSLQPGTPVAGVSAKEFMKTKQPITDVQRIACLAYYLTYNRNTTHFKTLDLTKLNTEAAGGSFSNPAVAVMHATSSYGYLAAAGGGKKQITALGEDIVTALPDQEQVKSIIAQSKSRKRRGSAKKKSKKKAAKA
jgi:hypothetical protein